MQDSKVREVFFSFLEQFSITLNSIRISISGSINHINKINNIWLKTKLVYNLTLPLNENKLPELLTIRALHQISNLLTYCGRVEMANILQISFWN